MEKGSIKILHVLRELNIGLDTLNRELTFLGLNGFDINQKVSIKDRDFIIAYFKTEQMRAIDNLRQDIAILHNQLKSFYLKNNPNPCNMGELEKRQYFKFLLGKKNITAPKVTKFSEDAFWSLYNWYTAWTKKSKIEQRDIIDEACSRTIDEEVDDVKSCSRIDSTDYESEFISAIKRGEGEVFGF